MTTFNRFFLSHTGELFFIDSDRGLIKAIEDRVDFKRSVLLLDDRFFFYEIMEKVNVRGKRLKDVIKNYLSVKYPDSMVSSYFKVVFDNFILIAIPTARFEVVDMEFLKKFVRVSTPFVEVLSIKERFFYRYDSVVIKVEDGMLDHVDSVTDDMDLISQDEAIHLITDVRLDILERETPIFAFLSRNRFLITYGLLLWLFMFAGFYFKAVNYSVIQKKLSEEIYSLYKKAGVSGYDPYGKLIYELDKLKKKKNFLHIIYKMSQALSGVIIDELKYENGVLTLKGVAGDFSKVDDIKDRLNEVLGEASVVNAKQMEGGVRFLINVNIVKR